MRRAFVGRRTSRNGSTRGSSQNTAQHASSGSSSLAPQKQSSVTNAGVDQAVKSGTSAGAGGAKEEKTAESKATSLLGNMFSGGDSKVSTSPAKESGSQGKDAKSTPPTKDSAKKESGFSASNLTSGLSNLFSGDGLKALTGATKSFDFSDTERKKAEAGLSALKKMAGKDGVLTPSDRENIIGQMNSALTAEKNRTVSGIADQKIQQAKNDRGPLRKRLFPGAPLVSKVGAKRKAQALNDPQHMNTARNTALGQLNQGFKDMGMDTKAPVNFHKGLSTARSLPAIGLNDTNAFKDTMLMVQQKAKSMGLPEGQFKKGLPVGFLQDVLGGKPAVSLLKHQVNPFGK